MTARPSWFRILLLLSGLALTCPTQGWAGLTPTEVRDFTSAKAKADRGDANALYNVGVCYSTGRGVAVDPVQAIVWWRKSAEKGYAPAMFNLGYVAINGDGMKPDPVQGAAWYLNSAKLGHVPALCNLGICGMVTVCWSSRV